jgi:membrane-bound inhibitor of C-type lysozyme
VTRPALLLLGVAAALASGAHAAERGATPFVVTYQCDGGRWLAVGYPAYADASRAPIRLSWQGKTVELLPARAGSGARYVNQKADLEWWSKGNSGFLQRASDSKQLVTGCAER